jgi:hypothetical protein
VVRDCLHYPINAIRRATLALEANLDRMDRMAPHAGEARPGPSSGGVAYGELVEAIEAANRALYRAKGTHHRDALVGHLAVLLDWQRLKLHRAKDGQTQDD